MPVWLMVTLVAFAVYSVNLRGDPRHDGLPAVPIAVSRVHDGDLTLDEYRDVPGCADHYSMSEHDGHLVGFFPWAVALPAVPVVVAFDAAHVVGVGPGADGAVRAMARWFAVMQNITAAWTTALAVGGMFVLVRRRRPDTGLRFALGATVIVALGTSLWSTAAATLWQHGPSVAAVTWGLVCLHDRRVALAGALFMLAVAFRPTNGLMLLAGLVVVVVASHRSWWRYLAGAAAVAVPWCAVTLVTYGTALQPYGDVNRLGLHDEFGDALAANLVSPGRGLFVFTPIAVLAVLGAVKVVRSHSRDPVLWVAVVVVPVHWVLVSLYHHWWGGNSYGPRLFTDVIPLLLVLAVTLGGAAGFTRAWARTATGAGVLVLAAAGVVVHAEGAVLLSTGCWSSHPVAIDADSSRVWSVSDALVTKGVRDLVHSPVGAVRGVCR
jgi:hypothetical protein